MKKIILSIVFAVSVFVTQSQSCTISLETQAAVDQFIIDNPTCTTINGNVIVNDYIADPITNLDGLQNVTTINGALNIIRTSGIDLQGISNLHTVETLEMSGHWSAAEMNDIAGIQTITYLIIDAYYMDDLHVFDDITTLISLNLNFFRFFQDGTLPHSFHNVFPNLSDVTFIGIGSYYGGGECDTLTGFNSVVNLDNLAIAPYDTEGFVCGHFDGFHNLQTISETLDLGTWFNWNGASAFENLQSVFSIQAWEWYSYYPLPRFESLHELDNIFIFSMAPIGPDFPSLNSIGSDANFYGNSEIFGPANLDSVGGALSIATFSYDYSPAPFAIHFDSLSYVGGDFLLSGSMIDDVSTFSNLEYVGGNVEITYNINLSACDIPFLCENIPINPAVFNIHDNAPGCNSGDEVLAACGESYAEGEVFYDLDCDGVFNNADVVLPYPIITNELDQTVGSSNSSGHYFVPLSDNSTATITVSGLPGYSTTPQTITTTNTANIFSDVHFALCPQPDLHNVSISQSWPAQFRPGFGRYQYFKITNLGPQAEDVALTYELTSMPGVTVSTITDGGMLSGNTIQWNNLSVPAFGYKMVQFYLQLDATIPIGQVLTSNVSVTIVPGTLVDIFPANNFLPLNYTVVGSYDPNDITVNIPAYNHDQLTPDEGLSLDYTIRFQNTGTAEAINVRVLDVIEEDLDLSSIEMIGTSHPCTLTFNENNQVEWLFENIMLPDSTSNEEASHGFIQYRIKTQPNLLLEDVIENTAAIYFDFNEPVITNTATTVFYACPVTPEPMADQTICEGEVVAFSGPTGWQDYSWTTFEGESSSTNQLQMMNLNVGFYEILFDASTEYCQYHDEVVVTVLSIPDSPVITQSGNTLAATGSGLFHWTLNGLEISDNDSSIEITESGAYGVSVASNGCASNETVADFTYIGVLENQLESEFSLMPNPMTQSTLLKVSAENISNMEVKISNALGQVILFQKLTSNTVVITNENLPDGVYYVSLIHENRTSNNTLKLIVSH